MPSTISIDAAGFGAMLSDRVGICPICGNMDWPVTEPRPCQHCHGAMLPIDAAVRLGWVEVEMAAGALVN